MASGREEFVADGVRPGFPALLAFGRAAAPEGTFEHADLFERIGRRHDRPFSRIFLHDPSGSGFYRGVSWLRGTIDETVAGLRTLIDELAPTEVITFGEGLGGHAALVFGALLGATRIVAIEPPSHLIADELARYNDRRWGRELGEFPDPALARRYDVPPLFDRAGFAGRAFVLFGTRRGNDHYDAVNLNVIHAHRLALSDRVTLCPFPEVWQGLLGELTRRGDAEEVLSPYLFDAAGPPREAPEVVGEERQSDERGNKFYYNFKYTLCHIEESRGYGGTTERSAYAAAGAVNPRADRRVDDGWGRWIAENLLLDASPASIETTLVANGYSEEDASLQVKRALESPYFWGARRLKARCAKRDWMLATYRKLNRLDPRSAEIGRRHRPSRGEFLDGYYAANRPVIITGMMDDWRALETWSPDFFSRRFGDRPDGVNLAAGEPSDDQTLLDELWGDVAPIPEYLDGRGCLAGTFRLGPAGTTAPFHPVPSNTFRAQVLGRVRVRIAPSWDGPMMEYYPQGPAAPDPRPPIPPSQLPLDQPQIAECIVNPGEILFLPVGCWSSDEALELSASLMFTNFLFDNDFPGGGAPRRDG